MSMPQGGVWACRRGFLSEHPCMGARGNPGWGDATATYIQNYLSHSRQLRRQCIHPCVMSLLETHERPGRAFVPGHGVIIPGFGVLLACLAM